MHTLTQAMRMSTMISSPSMVALMRDVWPLLYSLGRQTERKSKREREKRRGRDKRSGREGREREGGEGGEREGREREGREREGRGRETEIGLYSSEHYKMHRNTHTESVLYSSYS